MKHMMKDYLLLFGLGDNYSYFLEVCISEMNTGHEFVLNSAIKRKVISYLNIKMGTINNMITKLVQVGIFHRIDRGLYRLNVDLEKMINSPDQNLKLVLCYEKEQRKIYIETGGVK